MTGYEPWRGDGGDIPLHRILPLQVNRVAQLGVLVDVRIGDCQHGEISHILLNDLLMVFVILVALALAFGEVVVLGDSRLVELGLGLLLGDGVEGEFLAEGLDSLLVLLDVVGLLLLQVTDGVSLVVDHTLLLLDVLAEDLLDLLLRV